MTSPYIVATNSHQISGLVDLALRDPQYSSVRARTHLRASITVHDRPTFAAGDNPPRRWLQVGHFARFGGAMFVDEEVSDGEDWAWLALRPTMLHDTPTVYFEMESRTPFPPRCVMPVDELSEIVLEWATSGKRPTSVEWLAVNKLQWELDGTGDIEG